MKLCLGVAESVFAFREFFRECFGELRLLRQRCLARLEFLAAFCKLLLEFFGLLLLRCKGLLQFCDLLASIRLSLLQCEIGLLRFGCRDVGGFDLVFRLFRAGEQVLELSFERYIFANAFAEVFF